MYELKRLYMLNANPNDYKGWYYMSAYSGGSRLLAKLPATNKNFKDKWFWVGGNWGQH